MIPPDQVRLMALNLPDAMEQDHHGFPSYRVGGKIFATMRADARRLMVKLDPEDQDNLCAAHENVVTPVPGYWGRKGSTYVDLDHLDVETAHLLLKIAHAGARRGRGVKARRGRDASS